MDVTIEILKQWDEAYYNGGNSGIPDTDYDQHKTMLLLEFPDDVYFQTVGSTPTVNKVDLPYVLGSLKKKKYDGSALKWIQDNDVKEVCLSDKMDGCSIYVEYNHGTVQFASTRGNGYQGQNITDKAKVFCPVITFQGELHLRGEAMMLPDVSLGLGYKNPRNAVAGILNRDEHKNVESIIPVFYSILDDGNGNTTIETAKEHFHILDELGFTIPAYDTMQIEEPFGDIETYLAVYYKDRGITSPFGIDGIVVSNNIDYQMENEYYPTNTVAFKVSDPGVITEVTKVEWKVSRTGRVVPTVVVKPVDIQGSTISRATGHNAGFIQSQGIKRGVSLGIQKAGDIIPYIERVIQP
jgi:DNA ligase (NAD+)